MDLFSIWQASLERLEALSAWLLADILVLSNLVQIPAVALTGGVAWLLGGLLRRWLRVALQPGTAEGTGDWVRRHGEWAVQHLLPLITPALWLAGLWVSIVVAQRLGWPYDVARIGANLLVAWLVIRLVADLVPSRSLSRLIAIAAWSLAALNILHLLEPLVELLDAAALSFGRVRISALGVIKGLLSLAALLWVATLAIRLFERQIAQVAELSPRAQVLFGKLLKITLISLAFVLALAGVGIDLSTFAILTGAIGVGVGLGLQKTVSNLFSGFILILDRSIKPGDVIEVGGTYGWVSMLGARYVAVETRDGTEYLIPNEDIITHQVLNWSHKSERVRLKVSIRAPLDADLELVLALMREAAARPARILKTPAPNPVIIGFGETAVELQLRFWISDAPNGIHNVKSEVLLEIWKLFREHGIALPRPMRDVYLHAPEGQALPGRPEEPAPPSRPQAIARR